MTPRSTNWMLLLLVPLALLVMGCGSKAGEPCEITGSGFHAKDPCRGKCLSRWTARCPDGEVRPLGICAVEAGCTPGSCPQGQACYTFDDPIDERSYCVPSDACGAPLSARAQAEWERASAKRSAEVKAKWNARFGGSTPRVPTAPAPDLDAPD